MLCGVADNVVADNVVAGDVVADNAKRPHRWRQALVVSCALALLGAGCGSDSSDSSDDDGSAANSADSSADSSADGDATTAGSDAQATPTSLAASTPAATSDAGPETRAALLALGNYATLGGTTFDTSLTAGRDVLLWFWAPW